MYVIVDAPKTREALANFFQTNIQMYPNFFLLHDVMELLFDSVSVGFIQNLLTNF